MNQDEIKRLKEAEFSGFVTVNRLNLSTSLIPERKGVYVILRQQEEGMPAFLQKGSGPEYHGSQAMNYPVAELEKEWVEGTSIMYIGKTDNSLRKRLRAYLSFGRGNDVAHRGGRSIWQLPESGELMIVWKAINENESARELESSMLSMFKLEHDFRLPFANKTD